MKELFPSPCEYTAYMSRITFFIGILATTFSSFFSGSFIRKLGWKAGALLTPFIIVFTGIFFFYFLFSKHYFHSTTSILGISTLALSVFFGSMQNIFSRAAKYTVFDQTKEMAFLPLSAEDRIKGKSAIDGIGSRLGKFGSSLFMQLLLIIFATPVACSAFIIILIFVTIPIWTRNIYSLNKEFEEKTSTASSSTTDISLAKNT